jgi:hypothetical protein
LISDLDASFAHAFTQATVFQKILLKSLNLATEKIICLMNQANRNVCHYVGRSGICEIFNFRGIVCGVAQTTDIDGLF